MTRQLGGSATTSNQFNGVAQPVAQVKAFVLGAGVFIVGEFIHVDIYGRRYTYTVDSTVVDTVGANFIAAANLLSSATYPQVALFTWAYTAATNTITATHDTAGIEVPITLSTNSAAALIDGAASSVGANSTASAGPNHISSAGNWSLGVAPISDDEVVFADSSVSALYGLDQSAVTPDAIRIDASFLGQGGLWRSNAYGAETATRYVTYTGSADLQVLVGDGPGTGSPMFLLNTVAGLVNIDIQSTGTAIHDYAFIWKGTNAANTVSIASGSFAAAMDTGEVATIFGLVINAAPGKPRPRVFCGPGTTLNTASSTIKNRGGDLHTESACLTVTLENGAVWEHLNGTVTTANIDGTFKLKSGDTITTCNLFKDATLDLSASGLNVTVTNLNMYENSKVIDPLGLLQSFKYTTVGCTPNQVTVVRPKSKTYTES